MEMLLSNFQIISSYLVKSVLVVLTPVQLGLPLKVAKELAMTLGNSKLQPWRRGNQSELGVHVNVIVMPRQG